MESTKTVIVAAQQLKHVLEYKLNEDGQYSLLGIEGKLLQIITEALKFKLKIVAPPDGVWGSIQPDGNFTGLFGMLHRNEADLAMCFLGIFPGYMSFFDYSTPYLHEPVKFMVGKPKAQPTSVALLKTFDITVWACVGLSLLVLPIIFYFLLNESIGNTLLQFVGNLVKQPTWIPVVSTKHGILLAFWWFYALVISFSYSAAVLSFLSFPLEGESIRNFKQLSEAVLKGSHKCLTLRNSGIDFKLTQEPSSDRKELARMIAEKKWYFNMGYLMPEKDFEDTAILNMNFLLQVNYGYLVPDTCILSDDYIEASFTGISINKRFCCRHAVNNVISRLESAGIFSKIVKDEMVLNWILQKHQVQDKPKTASVNLQDVRGPFMLLFGGYIIATLAFIAEKAIFKLSKSKKQC